MDKTTDQSIRKFVREAAKQVSGLASAFLFGSFAMNKQRSESDIDIALIIKDLKDSEKFDIQVQLMLLAAKIDSRIEPHPFSANDFVVTNPFAHEIIKTGIEIHLAEMNPT